jgi:hypothetical protein
MLCSADEMAFIEKSLHTNGFNDLFFVVNRFDMIPGKEKQRISDFAIKKLSPLTSFGEKGIFFLSAKNALDAKAERDEEKLKQSGLPAFEKALSLYLTKEKGKAKLLSPSKALLSFLNEDALKKIIPQQQKKISTSVEDVGKDYDVIKAKADSLERKKSLSENTMKTGIQQLGYSFELIANKNVMQTVNSIPLWIENFVPTKKMGFVPTKAKISEITEEILSQVRKMLEENNSKWYRNDVLPEIMDKSDEIIMPVKNQVNEHIKKLHSEDAGTSGKENMFKRMNSKFFSMTAAKSAYATASPQLEMQITGKSLLTMMSASSSSLVKANTSTLFLAGIVGTDTSALKKLKEIISEEVVSNIRKASAEYARSVSGEVMEYFNCMADKAVAPLTDEISVLEDQLDSLFISKEKSESDINMKKERLKQAENEIKLLCNHLNEFIASS